MFLNHKRLMLSSFIIFSSVCAHSSNFNGSVIFGDSLSDGGNVGMATQGQPTKFTTNPGMTTAEIVADAIGYPTSASLLNGQNYAWGGATVSDLGTKVPNLQVQLGEYLAKNKGKANANTLYQVWGGSNDIFNLVEKYQTGNLNLTQLQSSLINVADTEIKILDHLNNAGARYVVVYNLPNMGLTPDAQASGPIAIGLMSQLSDAYNVRLNSGLEALSSKGLNIVPINVYGLLGEISQNSQAYGISHILDTACDGSSLGCTANGQGYMFADGVHPTYETHQLLAQVALSTLSAPQQMSLLAELPLMTRDAQIRTLRKIMLDDINGAETRAFINVDYEHQKINSSAYNPRVNSNNSNLSLGLDYRFTPNISGGVGLSLNQQNGDFGNQIGEYDLSAINGLIFTTYQQNRKYISAYMNAGRLDYKDITRQIQIGPMQRVQKAETKGSQYGIGFEAGYEFDIASQIKITPFTALDWQKVKVNGFKEKETDSTAMWFDDQKRESLISSLGMRLQGDTKWNSYTISPIIEVSWNHEFKDDALSVIAGSNTMGGHFEMKGYQPEKDWFKLNVGLNTQLASHLTSWVMISTELANHSKENLGASLGLKYLF